MKPTITHPVDPCPPQAGAFLCFSSSHRAAAFLCAAGLLLSAAPSWGDSIWIADEGSWHEGSNWNTFGAPFVPTASDVVAIGGPDSITNVTGEADAKLVNISNGATLNVAGSGASLTIPSPAEIDDDFGWVNVGIGSGSGTLNIRDGATVTAGVSLGASNGTPGTVTIDGPGSTWTSPAGIEAYLGWRGDASLTVSNGGTLAADSILMTGLSGSGFSDVNASAVLNIGAPSGESPAAPGIINAASITANTPGTTGEISSTVVFNHNDEMGYVFAPNIGGSLHVRHENGLTFPSGGFTHTGSTTVAGGALAIAGLTTTSDISVHEGALLSVSGLLGVANGGTIHVDGALIAPGASLSIANDITLSGSGTVVASTTIGSNGILAPGNSAGILSGTSETWAGGGKYLWEINQANGLPGAQWDLRQLSESLTITANSGTPFVLELISLDMDDNPGALANWDPYQTGQFWPIATAGSPITTFDPAAFLIDFDQFILVNPGTDPNGFSLALSNDQQSLLLHYDTDIAAIPEPGSAVALALLLAGSTGLHRHRGRKACSQKQRGSQTDRSAAFLSSLPGAPGQRPSCL